MHLSCVCPYMSLIADEVAQVAMLHVGQNHQRRALWRQADSQQGENVRVAEVLHDNALLQELGHLFQICDAFMKRKEKKKQVKGRKSWRCGQHLLKRSFRLQATGSHSAVLTSARRSILIYLWEKKDDDGNPKKKNPPQISSPRPDPHQTPICRLHLWL